MDTCKVPTVSTRRRFNCVHCYFQSITAKWLLLTRLSRILWTCLKSYLIWSPPPIRHLAISSAFFGWVKCKMMNSNAILNSETKTLPDQENRDEKEVWHKHRHIPSPAEISLHTWKKITFNYFDYDAKIMCHLVFKKQWLILESLQNCFECFNFSFPIQ